MSDVYGVKQLILDIASDSAVAFIYYDRKECESLPIGAIEKAIADKIITVDEIVDRFRNELEDCIEESDVE